MRISSGSECRVATVAGLPDERRFCASGRVAANLGAATFSVRANRQGSEEWSRRWWKDKSPVLQLPAKAATGTKAIRPAEKGPALRAPARPHISAAPRAEKFARCGDHRLPVRRRSLLAAAAALIVARGEIANALRNGSMPGTESADRRPSFFSAGSRIRCGRRSFRRESRVWRTRSRSDSGTC